MNNFAFVAMAVFVAILLLSVVSYAFVKCGPKAFLLGNGAVYAAMSGMCDE